jgi:hypothetical protein
MQKFYDNYDSINQFTLSLDYHQNDVECSHCLKSDQFVSHGIIYKQHSISYSEKVGKRIFCSNRYGRNGCGKTFQLYIASKIPHLRYGAAELFVFIASLLANLTITESYQKATEQFETRNAWRWINRLMFTLTDYRSYLKVRGNPPWAPLGACSHRLRHLLPTLSRLAKMAGCPCQSYQQQRQRPFF